MKKNQETAHAILLEILNGTRPLTEDGIRVLVQEDLEIAELLILGQARRIGAKQRKAASTPLGMIPPHEKPNTQKDKKKKKQRGRKSGHKGACRKNPEAITQTVEQQICFAVVMQKVCQGQSEKGAWVKSVLMTIFRTLKRRCLNLVAEVVNALKTWIATGTLPPFPVPTVAEG